MNNQTIVLTFGKAVQTASGLLLAEIDALMHRDSDGGRITRFEPGTNVFFLLHHDPAIRIVRVDDTGGGNVYRLGEVTRTGMQKGVTFTHPQAQIMLQHIPSGPPSASWYGESSTLVVRKRQAISAPSAPCLGDISYQYRAWQYRYVPPAMNLSVDQEFPVDIIIEYRGEA